MPTSSRGRSRSASPSTAAGRSSSSSAPAASGRTSPSCTRRTPTVPSSICWRRAARRSAPARRPRPTSRTASSRRRGSSIGGFRSASAPTRTFASTRSRSCARWKASPGARPAPAASSRRSGCSASAPTKAAARWGSSRGPTSRSTSAHRLAAGRRAGRCLRRARLELQRRRRREQLAPAEGDVVEPDGAVQRVRAQGQSARTRLPSAAWRRRQLCASEVLRVPTSTAALPGGPRSRTRRSRREALAFVAVNPRR